MADVSDTLNSLVSKFDTSPAGTREEAEMAQSLSEAIHLHGLETINQDFTYANYRKPVAAAALVLCGVFGILGGIASGALPVIMLILTFACAAVFVLESMGKTFVSSLLGKGYSQNLIARHPAAKGASSKARPVVIVAHYDTPRADIMSLPVLRSLAPYLDMATYISLAVILVCTLAQVIPFPQGLHNFAWALSIVAAIIVIFSGVRVLLNAFVLPYTAGSNDNMSGVAALLGILDRVRPAMGSEFVSASAAAQGIAADDERPSRPSRERESREQVSETRAAARIDARTEREGDSTLEEARRARRRTRRLEHAPIRRGAEVLRSLGMVSDSCEIVYEEPADETIVAPAPVRDSRPQKADAVVDVRTQGDVETTGKPATDHSPATVRPTSRRARKDVNDEPAPERRARTAAAATTSATATAAPVAAGRTHEDARTQASPAATQAPAVTGSTTVLTHETLKADQRTANSARAQALAPDPTTRNEPLDVIISSDEPDAELRHGPVSLPRDMAEQQGDVVSDDARRDSILNNPNWGTTSFKPVQQSRRVIEDLPDPAVAAVDPFSVASVETIGDFDPDDFSSMNFETGTHEAVTPHMLEEARRSSLDGFEDISDGSRKGKREKRRQRGERMGHRAQQMQQQMEEQSFSDWLGVDDDYDAQTNGRQIGSWDNFEDDVRQPAATNDADATRVIPDPADEPTTGDRGTGRRWQGGAVRARGRRSRAAEPGVEQDDAQLRSAAMALGDADLVSHEIWFVLTGASEADHAGMEEFLDEYDQRLHNAYFINLDCVGAGRQALVLEEGGIKPRKADRRLVNLIGTVSSDFNRPLALARMPWLDSEATPVLRRGRHAVTVCGVEDGALANARSTKDTPENVSAAKVADVTDILVEVIKRV